MSMMVVRNSEYLRFVVHIVQHVDAAVRERLRAERRARAYATFRAQLRQYREANGLTQRGLCEALGASNTLVWRMESQEDANPEFDTIFDFADFFGVTLGSLFGEETKQSLGPTSWRFQVLQILEEMSPSQRSAWIQLLRSWPLPSP